MLKSIEAYFASVHDHGDTDVWSWCPDSIRESQALVRGEADFLYRFLTAAPEDNASSTKRYYVMHQGHRLDLHRALQHRGAIHQAADRQSMLIVMETYDPVECVWTQ